MLNYTTLQTIIQLVRMFFDILILWVLLYYTIKIVRNNSRTAQIFKGIVLILIIRAVANFFGFKAVDWLAGVLVTYGFLAIIIIFQPEIRSVLERLGKSSVFSRLNTLSSNERMRLVDELVNASMALSQNRMGALISIEQGHSLSDFIRTGTLMNSLVTSDLLQTIFVPSTPLHDGAVIIQGDRIACASAYFPPTNLEVPSRYGARHRAAIGISEITDSVTIVISEKSGRISIAEEGKLITMNQITLRSYLEQVIINDEADVFETDPSRVLLPTPKEASPSQLEPAVQAMTSPEVPTSAPVKRVGFFKALFNPEPTAIDVELDVETPKVAPKENVPASKVHAKSEPEVKLESELNPPTQAEPAEPKPERSPKTSLWKRWFGSKKAPEVSPESTPDVKDEPPKKAASPKRKAATAKKESTKTPVKRSRKPASKAVEKIKDTPKIELEYSLSDPSLLDDDDAQGGGDA